MARNRTKPETATGKNHGDDIGSEGCDTEARSSNSQSAESQAAEESSDHSSAAEESSGHSSAAEESSGHSSAGEESGKSSEAEESGHSSAAEEGSEQREDSDEEEIKQLFEQQSRKKGKKTATNGEASQGKKSWGKMEKGERNGGKKGNKGKKIVVKDESRESESSACKFPMNRIYRIMKDQRCSSKIGQETIFLANKAVENFLELYCREAYACAFLEHKNQIAYDNLASVVSKRERFKFLSDIVPERVKAEDALAEIKEEE